MIDKWIEHIVQVSMVVFPVSPYFNQYLKLKHSNQGFSLHVCGGLMLSNIFKIFFWYCKRFDVTILVQGITMFAVQLWLLTASKSTIRIKRHFPYNDVEVLGLYFYLYVLTIQLIILIAFQFGSGDDPIYVESIGFLGVALEAAVPGFQVFRNFRNQSVKGFSELVLLVWFTGDICKIVYHLYFRNPIQFVLCGVVQVSFDLILFYQFYIYSNTIFDPNKEPDEQRRLLSEDPSEYYPYYSNRYDNSSSSNQFEAKPSHQRFLTEGTVHENAYDEAVMDPKPRIVSKPVNDDPNTSFSSINSKSKIGNKGKNIIVEIQGEEEENCPPENEHDYNTSFNNSLSSFRSYQYANIRNSNYHYLHRNSSSNIGNNINNNNNSSNNEQYDAINYILNMKNKVRSINNNTNSNEINISNNQDSNRRGSIATFGSFNSSLSNEPSFIFEGNRSFLSEQNPDNSYANPTTMNRTLNRSKSIQFPHHQFKQLNYNATNNNSYHGNISNLQRSNSQRNPVSNSRNQRTNNL